MTDAFERVPKSPVDEDVERAASELALAKRAVDLDRSPAFPTAEFRALGDRGLLGLRIPTKLGGRGLTLPEAGAALYRLAFRSGTTFAKICLQPEFASVLAEHGSAELVEEHFRPLVRGRRLIGNQITEPSAGSDAAALTTTAQRHGEEYVLTGEKSEAAFATDASHAIVYARTGRAEDGARAITALLVQQDLPGITRETVPDLGERWMRRGRVRYDGARVPAQCRIGEEGAAFGYLKEELTRERALLAAIYLGVGRSSFEETVEHVGNRQAFGRPLSANQAVAFPLVEDWARLDAATDFCFHTLRKLDEGGAADARAALAKWLATETALEAIDHAIQFHGGRGYSSELPHERRYRDVRSGGIAHGPSEVMHLVASRSLWPRRERPDFGAGRIPVA